jgi:hypothetical protein
MEPAEVDETSAYDLSFTANNYRRYFKYEDRTVKNEKKQLGVCRKCNVDVPRTGGNTSGMKNHMKNCDSDAWNELDKRKSRSVPSTPKQFKATNQPIVGFFEVSFGCF